MSETWDRLQQTMRDLGIEPKKSLGQNFLISDSVVQKIIRAAEQTKPDFLLEIGPGPGALTFHLKNLCSQFQLIELDRQFAQFWRDQNLAVVEADALQIEWSDFLSQSGVRTLVSNLPYQISSSLVIDRCLDDSPLDFMVLMFQKEVAQRIRARLQDELYGMLSVVAQTFWKMATVADVGNQDFFPPPKIASRVLSFERKESPVSDRRAYFKFVKAAFVHPRKLMVSNLEERLPITKARASEIMLSFGLSEKTRAGQLSVQQFVDFFHKLG